MRRQKLSLHRMLHRQIRILKILKSHLQVKADKFLLALMGYDLRFPLTPSLKTFRSGRYPPRNIKTLFSPRIPDTMSLRTVETMALLYRALPARFAVRQIISLL